MIRLAVVLLCAPLWAQLQLAVVTSSGEKPAGTQYTVGASPAGESTDVRFRIRNAAQAPQDVQRISAAGIGFTIPDRPPLPYRLASGAAVDFTVRFQPSSPGSYSAVLTVNSLDVLLIGAGVATATLKGTPGGGTIDFGRAERGQRIVRRLALENVFNTAVTVREIRVGGAGFSGPGLIALPLTVSAQSSADFEIYFQPPAAGGYTGTLGIDQRSYKLTGVAVNPPNPKPVIATDTVTLASAVQAKAAVRFEAPARVDGKGVLTIELRPDPGVPADPAVVFSNGGTVAEFTFHEGESEARFSGATAIGYQTGTTTGTLVLSARLGEYNESLALPIAAEPVAIQSVRTSHNSFSVIVDVVGYDNTRTVTQVVYTFTDTRGSALPAIRADAANDFRRYFESSQAGGAFLLHAVFPVTGNVAEIGSVEVGMVNSAGTSRPQSTQIQ